MVASSLSGSSEGDKEAEDTLNSHEIKDTIWNTQSRASVVSDASGVWIRHHLARMRSDTSNRTESGDWFEDSLRVRDWLCWRPRYHNSLFQQWEPKDLHLNALASRRLGFNTSWYDLNFTDQVAVLRDNLKSKHLSIDPNSRYMKMWDAVLLICQCVIAVVTPYEIAFLHQVELFGWLYFFNRLIDAIFLKDMILKFFLQVQVMGPHGLKWIRNPRRIARIYFTSWFLPDVLSMLPYDHLTDILPAGHGYDKLKVMRLLRLCRLIKLHRVLRASRLLRRLQNAITISSATLYLLKFFVVMFIACHWMACFWGFIGIFNATQLKCLDSMPAPHPEMMEYPSRRYFIDLPDDPQDFSLWYGYTWVVAFAANNAPGTSVNPCDSFTIYVAAMYWSVMTTTSIGYGDILPTSKLEYSVCTLCMLIGSIIWAYIIGAICTIISTMNPEQLEYDHALDDFNKMAQGINLPHKLRLRCREYIREGRWHKKMIRRKQVVANLGRSLQGAVSNVLSHQYMSSVWYLTAGSCVFRQDLSIRFMPTFYERREEIAAFGSLHVVERGLVARCGRVLVRGKCWGEDMIISLSDLQLQLLSIALTHTEIMSLGREDLWSILPDHPVESKIIRKAAVLMALRRALQIYHEDRLAGRISVGSEWIHELFDNTGPLDQKVGPHRKEVQPSVGVRLEQMQAQLDTITRLLQIQCCHRHLCKDVGLGSLMDEPKLLSATESSCMEESDAQDVPTERCRGHVWKNESHAEDVPMEKCTGHVWRQL